MGGAEKGAEIHLWINFCRELSQVDVGHTEGIRKGLERQGMEDEIPLPGCSLTPGQTQPVPGEVAPAAPEAPPCRP